MKNSNNEFQGTIHTDYYVEGVPHLDTAQLKQIIEQPHHPAIIIDIRELNEYAAGHIPTIPLIPMGEIVDHMDLMDKEREYIFVCRSGNRSLNVSKYFQNNGYERVYNYAGGMLGWDGEVAEGPEHVITELNNIDELMRK